MIDMDKTYNTKLEDNAEIIRKEILDTVEKVKNCLIEIYTAENAAPEAKIEIDINPEYISMHVTENKHFYI